MPIYEYRCDTCGAEFEKRVSKPEDSAGVRCPSCNEARLTQRLSTFSAKMGSSRSPSGPSCPSAGCCPNAGTCGLG
jgi:putative FmdB family regulatory protein